MKSKVELVSSFVVIKMFGFVHVWHAFQNPYNNVNIIISLWSYWHKCRQILCHWPSLFLYQRKIELMYLFDWSACTRPGDGAVIYVFFASISILLCCYSALGLFWRCSILCEFLFLFCFDHFFNKLTSSRRTYKWPHSLNHDHNSKSITEFL